MRGRRADPDAAAAARRARRRRSMRWSAAPASSRPSGCCASTGFGTRMAFNVTARVYRSGGFSKDAIYLRGFKQVLDLLAVGKRPRALLVRQDRRPPRARGRGAGRARPAAARRAACPQFLARPDAQARIATHAQRTRAVATPLKDQSRMLIAFFVNDMAKEFPNYTTTVLAHEAVQRGHRVCYITPGDFVMLPDDSMQIHARMAPDKKAKTHTDFFKGVQEVGEKTDADRDERRRRAVAAQRPVARRADRALGGGSRHPVRARSGQARRAGAQRPQQPQPRGQQDVLPVLPRGGAGRDPDHQARQRREGRSPRSMAASASSSRCRDRAGRACSSSTRRMRPTSTR